MRSWKLFLLTLLINILSLSYADAQKTVNEATLTYKISTESTNDKAAMAKSLEGATLTVYIKGTQSKTEMVSAMGTESNMFDSKSGAGIILKQYSGQKLMITLNGNNWAQKNRAYQNTKFSIDNAEQNVGGFKCKKATGQFPDGNTVVIYFTPEIIMANKQYDNAFTQLPGLPVQYELQSNKLKFTYTLTNVNYDPVPLSKFDVPKTGFRTMTYEETQHLKKGEN